MLTIRLDKPPASFPFPNAWRDTWTVISLTDLGDGRTAVRMAGLGYTAEAESQRMRQFFEAGNAWTMRQLVSQFEASPDTPQAADTSQPSATSTARASAMPESRPAHAPDPLAPIEIERLINCPRADAWKLLSTSAGWKAFLGVESKIELHPGGPFEIYFAPNGPPGERGSEGCTVLSYVPERMLSYTWNAPPKFPRARAERTWVVITLDDISAARTRVRLMHLGFREQAASQPETADEWHGTRAYFAAAWPNVLAALAEKGAVAAAAAR